MKNKLNKLALVVTLAFTTLSYATPNIQQLENKIKISNIKSVKETPIPGLYEVLTDTNLVYSTNTGDFIIIGELFNTNTQESLSKLALKDLILKADQQRIADFKNNIDYFKHNSIIETLGTGEKELFMFTNPDCVYCRKLEPELSKLQNTTIYRIVISATPETLEKTNNIWCSTDKLNSWLEAILNKKIPETKTCATPILKNLELADKLRITGTPTMLNKFGKELKGVRPITDIEHLITLKDNK